MTRVDTQLSESNSLFIRYGMSDSFKGTPQAVPTTTFTNEGRRQWIAIGLDRIFSPNLLNTFRAGFTRNSDLDDSYFNINVDPKYSFVRGLPPGRITIGGGVTTAGSHNWSPRRYHQNQFEYSDSVYYQRGLHAFKMGAMVKRVQSNPMVQTNLRGQFGFANIRAFLEGKPNLYSGIAVNGYPYGYRQTIMGFYAQDDYRVRPNLTLNLGLRWEFSMDPTEVNGKFANYVDIYTDTAPHAGEGINLKKKNIQPRFGFAWSLSDKTAIRGGVGLYHETAYPILYTNYSSTLQPFHWDLRVRTPGFPDPFAGGTVVADPPGGWPRELENHSPSKLQYNLNVQHEVLRNTNLTVGYVGSQSRHTPLQTFPNERRPTLRDGRHYWEPNAPLVNPALGELRYACRCGSGNYNGLVVSLTRRPTGLLGFQISYTWSKNLDYNSTIAGVETETSTSNVMNPYDIKADYGRSVFDVRHAFVFNHTLTLPSTNMGGAAGAVLNGWGLQGILRANTGTPMNIAAGVNRARNRRTITGAGDDRPDLVPGRSNDPILGDPYLWYDPTAFVLAEPGYFGNLARNTVTGPGMFNYDFSVAKGFSISERTKLEFRSEFFNLFNMPHFGVPGRSVFTTTGARVATAGRILSTVGDSRQIQFSLKMTF
ncbi:MAG: hypothetical protein A3G20_01080 [Acidobacteria bacterium RIFCSPLOWO2_12_FULL_59_11]|nr:MAG: hypothetical protein A3G20_01080 [Acidobacteria bacterium RIFCSPLOWO2_12_FULL_59_11]